MNYKYVAYTRSDKKLMKGNISGTSAQAASQSLLSQGYQIVKLKQAASLPSAEKIFPSLFKVKSKDVITFSNQLATLLDAGIAIVPALLLIKDETNNRAFKAVVTQIVDDLRAGNSFAEAVSRHDKIFNTLFCQIMSVGERTGCLADSLRQAAIHLEKDDAIKKKIKKALTYPAIVFVVAIIVVGILTAFVIPRLTKVLKDLEVSLPITTRIMMNFTDFVSAQWPMLFGAMLLAVLAMVIYVRRPSGRYKFDQLMLTIPVIGKANLMGEMARLSRTLALLVRVGLPLPQTLEMSRKTSSNVVIQRALADVRTELMQGEGLSGPMSKNKVFPSLLVQMVMVGEESGKLSSTLETASLGYEAEADDRINAAISMIEPLMIMSLAVLVGFIAISTITPMYSLYGAIK